MRTLADIMTTDLVTFTPDTNIHKAIHTLVENEYSGAPVVDDNGNLVGMLSRKDCLRIVFTSAYHQDWGGPVSEYMSSDLVTLDITLDIVSAAQTFLETPFHRFPVMKDGRLVGQVSRHDILKVMVEDHGAV